jgi:predicted dehydrogenase
VSIASYDSAHAEQVVAAVRAGKHVFVEKPLCLLDEEFEAIDRALTENPRVRLSSNLILRGAPQFREIKARVESGALGRLYYLEGDYNYGRLQKITDGWRGKIDFYSVTHGGAIHMIDLLLWLSQRNVVDVVAFGNQIASSGTTFRFPDMVSALLRFDDGMTAKVSANFGCVCPHHHVLSVYGTAGTFLHGQRGGVFYDSRDPAIRGEDVQLDYPTAAKGNVQRSFVRHLLDGTPLEVDVADVMNAMATALAIERSLRSGTREAVQAAQGSRSPSR